MVVLTAAEVGVASALLWLGFRLGWSQSFALDSLFTVLVVVLIIAALEAVVRFVVGWKGAGESVRVRGITLQVVVDVCLVWAAYYAAYRLRFGNGDALRVNFEHFHASFPMVLGTQICLLALMGAYRVAPRKVGVAELGVLGKAVLLHGVGAQLVLLYLYSFLGYYGYTRRVFGIYAIVLVVLLAASRWLPRLVGEAPLLWKRAGREARLAVVLAGVCLGTGFMWGTVVPPFEAPDEIYISRIAFNDPGAPPAWSYDPMYFLLAQPLLQIAFDAAIPFDAPTNPAFRFVSNKQGQVNMFQHGRERRPAGRQLGGLYALRALAVALSTATVLLIYFMAARFFSNANIAVMVAGLCLFTPQFSFMGSKAHPEVMAFLWGAAVNFILILRATGRLGRTSSWGLLIPLVLAALFTDSVSFFLVAFVPIAMLLAERDWRSRWITAGVIGTGGLILAAGGHLYVSGSPGAATALRTSLTGLLHLTNAEQMSKLTSPFSPFVQAPDTLQYFLFEFWPKLFFGFWGWLGQPSVLLPAWTYAMLLDLVFMAGLGLAALCVTRVRIAAAITPDRRRVLMIAAAGVVLILIPIVYAAVLWQRNAWYGRWLFPMIGPMMILLTVGMQAFVISVWKRPHVASALLALAAGGLVLLWMAAPGDWVRAGVGANHYGDQAHLIRTIRNAVLGLALVPLLIELGVTAKAVGSKLYGGGLPWRLRASAPILIFASAGALNLLLLFGFVRPLYQPLDAAGYVAAIREETGLREFKRAAGVASVAIDEYPESPEIARLVAVTLLRAGQYEDLREYFNARLARGVSIDTRTELMALARTIRVEGWPDRTLLGGPLRAADARPALRDAAALLRLSTEKPAAADLVKAAVLGQAGATPLNAKPPTGGSLEGFTVQALEDGRRQIVLFFQPVGPWKGRRLWIHAYPDGSSDYVDLGADPPPFDGWQQGELAWEVFETPRPGRFTLYAGISVGDDLGPAHPLGVVGDAAARRVTVTALPAGAAVYPPRAERYRSPFAGGASLTPAPL